MLDTGFLLGASKSCQVFQRLSDAISRMMGRRCLAVVSYLDNIICIAEVECKCFHVFNTLNDLLEHLGLMVNWSKVVLPTQKITFLGVNINSCSRRLPCQNQNFMC
jgi:hypothetical protein